MIWWCCIFYKGKYLGKNMHMKFYLYHYNYMMGGIQVYNSSHLKFVQILLKLIAMWWRVGDKVMIWWWWWCIFNTGKYLGKNMQHTHAYEILPISLGSSPFQSYNNSHLKFGQNANIDIYITNKVCFCGRPLWRMCDIWSSLERECSYRYLWRKVKYKELDCRLRSSICPWLHTLINLNL